VLNFLWFKEENFIYQVWIELYFIKSIKKTSLESKKLKGFDYPEKDSFEIFMNITWLKKS